MVGEAAVGAHVEHLADAAGGVAQVVGLGVYVHDIDVRLIDPTFQEDLVRAAFED